MAHANTTHGHAGHRGERKPSRTYQSWSSMIQRCTNPKKQAYRNYGGRGITVCAQWRTFAGFLADMGECPTDRTLDRMHNDGNYEPGNCRWATTKEQNRNRRGVRLITFRGRTLSVHEWDEVLGLAENAVRKRLIRGWSIEDALTTPAQSVRGPRRHLRSHPANTMDLRRRAV